jgi:hypothetical protein
MMLFNEMHVRAGSGEAWEHHDEGSPLDIPQTILFFGEL